MTGPWRGLAFGVALGLVACDGPPQATPPPGPAAPSSTPSVAAPIEAGPPQPRLSWLERELRAGDDRWLDWLARAPELRLQILVTLVAPDRPWQTHELRVDAEYFYPASAIKTFLAVGALRIMNRRAGEGEQAEIHPRTLIRRCRRDKPDCWPPRPDEEEEDPASTPRDEGVEEEKKKHRKLRVKSEVHNLLSYSDNDSYNRLWDVAGHREINEEMGRFGFPEVRFHHRMNAPADKSRRTLRVLLLPPGKRAIVVKRRQSDLELAATPAAGLAIGKGHNRGGKLVDEPLDFNTMNYVSLRDLQRLNVALLYPERKGVVSLGLTDDQRDYVVAAMTRRLKQAKHAAVHGPLSPGVLEVLPHERVRYIGKSGRAYGFHLENAYLEDRRTGRALFVTVTVYANPNGILNDDDYGYDDTTKPMLASLGAVLTRKWLAPAQAPVTDGGP